MRLDDNSSSMTSCGMLDNGELSQAQVDQMGLDPHHRRIKTGLNSEQFVDSTGGLCFGTLSIGNGDESNLGPAPQAAACGRCG